MNDREQTDALYHDLNIVIIRYSEEFQVSVASALGVLEILKIRILKAADQEWEEE